MLAATSQLLKKLLRQISLMFKACSDEDLDKKMKIQAHSHSLTFSTHEDSRSWKRNARQTQEANLSPLDLKDNNASGASSNAAYKRPEVFLPTGSSSAPRKDSTNIVHPLASSRRESMAVSICEDVELDTQTMRINVGGRVFVVTKDTLRRYPGTLLGSLSPASPAYNRGKREYFFDRNPTIFDSVLDLYRTNELHLPRDTCGMTALKELQFWDIPAIWVSACCFSNIHDAIRDKRLFKDLRGSDSRHSHVHFRVGRLRNMLWKTLYDIQGPPLASQAWNITIAVLIGLSLLVFFGDSWTEIVPHDYFTTYLAPNASSKTSPLPPRRNRNVWLLEMVILTLLLVEIILKMVVCPSLVFFFRNFVNVLYGLSLVASLAGHMAEIVMERPENWTEVTSLDTVYLFTRCVRWLRTVRFLELLDFNASLHVMWVATTRCHTELLLLLVVFLFLATFFGAITFYIEHNTMMPTPATKDSQETGSIDDGKKHQHFAHDLMGSLYWAIITMTTVGYGDITPSTTFGRVVGALCSLSGVIVLALPVAILTESFQQYNIRQKIRLEKRKHQDDFFRSRTNLNDAQFLEQFSI